MKKLILLSLLTLQFGLLAAQNADGQGRLSHLFNFGWKFHAGDLKDAYSVNYDDSSWRVLDLPHDFQIEQPWDKDAGGMVKPKVDFYLVELVGIVKHLKPILNGKENGYYSILKELC